MQTPSRVALLQQMMCSFFLTLGSRYAASAMRASFSPRCRRPGAAFTMLILACSLCLVATCSAFQVSSSPLHASNRQSNSLNSYARSHSQSHHHASSRYSLLCDTLRSHGSRYLPVSAFRLAASKEDGDDSEDPDAWDSPEDYADFGKDTSNNNKKSTGLGGQPSLGIDIGGQLTPSPTRRPPSSAPRAPRPSRMRLRPVSTRSRTSRPPYEKTLNGAARHSVPRPTCARGRRPRSSWGRLTG